MGPDGFQNADVYLRTAVGVDPSGWAKFGHVKMPEYRWGILLAPKEEGRTIPCGRHKGQPAWQEVPGEYRSLLRRLIVVQGDTEPASVEQQRFLGATAPSLYDMRNLFQVNVEEGRHLWAMVYLLVKYFGKDGREEAQALLERRSGHQDNPRILGAFNERTPDWLSFFMFTYFTDRDGKMQLAALAQSGFDPLSRSCRFMLTEEAHHLFVGETGVGRTIEATCAAMKAAGITDPYDTERHPQARRDRPAHAADEGQLPHVRDARPVRLGNLVQRRRSLQLGPQGPLQRDQPHRRPPARKRHLPGAARGGRQASSTEDVPALRAINSRLLDDYIADCQGGIDRWNKAIEKAGIDFEFTQPHKAFNRKIGEFARSPRQPGGRTADGRSLERAEGEWLCNDDGHAFINSLMKPCLEPGQYASWIAPPRVGINNQPKDFEYVRIEHS